MFLSNIKRYTTRLFVVLVVLSLCCACTAPRSTDKPQKTQTTAPQSTGTSEVTQVTQTTKTTQTTRPVVLSDEEKYAAALAALADKDYAEAHALLSPLGDYKDAAALLEKFVFRPTEIRWKRGHSEGGSTFTYDDRGNCIKIVHNDGNESVFTYDGIGYPIQRVYKSNKTVESTMHYTYNESGALVEETQRTEYGEYTFYYEYDKNGRLRKQSVTYDDDTYPESEVLEFFYDDRGNCIQTYGHYAVGDHVNKYTYDENGRCIHQVHAADGGESTFEYDAYGNRVKQVLTPYFEEREGWVATYTYEPFYFEDGIPGDWQVFIDRWVYDMY